MHIAPVELAELACRQAEVACILAGPACKQVEAASRQAEGDALAGPACRQVEVDALGEAVHKRAEVVLRVLARSW